MKKKKLALKITVIAVLCIIAAVTAFGGVCLHLMTQDNISDKYTLTAEERDGSFLGTLLKGAMRGSETELTEAQVNTYLNDAFCGQDRMLRNVKVYFHKDAPVGIYAKIYYLNRELAFSANAIIELEPEKGRAALRISDVKLGELKVHSPVIDSVLSSFAGSTNLAEYTDGILYIKTEYSYNGKNFNINLHLEKFEPADGTVKCKTNSLTWELIGALKDYLRSDDGQSFVRQYFGEKVNNIKNLLLDLFF